MAVVLKRCEPVPFPGGVCVRATVRRRVAAARSSVDVMMGRDVRVTVHSQVLGQAAMQRPADERHQHGHEAEHEAAQKHRREQVHRPASAAPDAHP